MPRIAWLTDIHLNFLGTQQIETFLDDIRAQRPDGLIITGDIGESHSLDVFLMRMADHIQKPIYFVLGNHDFYFSSIERVRAGVTRLHEDYEHLYWLPQVNVITLAPGVGLVGHDGWADGRLGDFHQSDVILNDYLLIQELAGLGPAMLLKQLNQLGDEAADHFRRVLPIALERHSHIFVATHVPPFKAACWHQGQISDDNFLPHFSNKGIGDVLLDIATEYSDHTFTVLCGHTHGAGDVQIRPNLRVITGGAEYGAPIVNRLFNI